MDIMWKKAKILRSQLDALAGSRLRPVPHRGALFPITMGSLRLHVQKQEAENRQLADAILTGHRQAGVTAVEPGLAGGPAGPTRRAEGAGGHAEGIWLRRRHQAQKQRAVKVEGLWPSMLGLGKLLPLRMAKMVPSAIEVMEFARG